MLRHYVTFQLIWLSLALTASTTSTINSTTITKPEYQQKCENLTVPYPFGFGIGSGCSIDPWFDINCNTSFSPPKPFLNVGNMEVHFAMLKIGGYPGRFQFKLQDMSAYGCQTKFTVL
ncbi:hypothetical protein RJ640_001583 [Escallonia rubra]|uniref:Wall-associated receptor kinase galacturonan-binding domain-containing protein n=1 Tax=Escallonia rubra TaxID=112253 RepID=A0AA88S014_9ASTE|nr:hypothetical protein RJ640_001583 [Escallonia rubra]